MQTLMNSFIHHKKILHVIEAKRTYKIFNNYTNDKFMIHQNITRSHA